MLEGVVFHCERRARVLLRDILRFGTATISSSLFWEKSRCFGQTSIGSALIVSQILQRRPPGVDRVVLMVRFIPKPRATLVAQTGTIR